MYYRKSDSGRVITREKLRPRIRIDSVEEIRECLGRAQTAVVRGVYASSIIIARPTVEDVLAAILSHIERAELYDAAVQVELLAAGRRLALASTALVYFDDGRRRSDRAFERGEWMVGNYEKRKGDVDSKPAQAIEKKLCEACKYFFINSMDAENYCEVCMSTDCNNFTEEPDHAKILERLNDRAES